MPKPMMKISTTNPKTVKMNYGFVPISQNTGNGLKPSEDVGWQNVMNQLYGISYIEDSGGSLAVWTNYIAPPLLSDGYNGNRADCAKRGMDFNTVVSGVLAKHYGFGFFEDDLIVGQKLNPAKYKDFAPVLNLTTPILDGSIAAPNYTRINSQIDYIFAYTRQQGIRINGWRLGYEAQVKGNADWCPDTQTLQKLTQTITTYILRQDPTSKITVNARLVDDNVCRLVDMNKVMSSITGITSAEQYFQIQDGTNTYPLIRARLAEFPSFLDEFQKEFPTQKMVLAQQQFGLIIGTVIQPNPYQDKIGQMLAMSELLMRCIIENSNRNDVISDFSHSQINGIVSGAKNQIKPLFYAYKLLQSALINDGLLSVEFQNIAGSENLIPIAVKNGNVSEVHILNPTPTDILIPITQTDNHHRNVTAEGVYGDLMATQVTNYSSPIMQDSFVVKGYGVTKVTTDK